MQGPLQLEFIEQLSDIQALKHYWQHFTGNLADSDTYNSLDAHFIKEL